MRKIAFLGGRRSLKDAVAAEEAGEEVDIMSLPPPYPFYHRSGRTTYHGILLAP